jgi:hypothetical protein
MRAAVIAAVLSVAATTYAQEPIAPSAHVRAEFRVFSGAEEITASTRLRVMPTGKREQPMQLAEGKMPAADLAPGIYDVQALRLRQESIVGIQWAERLVVMHYPDEAGRHLEVINFQPGFGALQVRTMRLPISGVDVAVFALGQRTAPATRALEGDGYKLFVLPAGRYDIRVRAAGTGDAEPESRWFLDVEIPSDRTRLKVVGP